MGRFDPGDPPEVIWAGWEESATEPGVWHFGVGDEEHAYCGAGRAEEPTPYTGPGDEPTDGKCLACREKLDAAHQEDAKAADAEYQLHLEETYTDAALARKINALHDPGRGGANDYERGFGAGWHEARQSIMKLIERPPPEPLELPDRDESQDDLAFDAARERERRR
jgi:hypothetical protein